MNWIPRHRPDAAQPARRRAWLAAAPLIACLAAAYPATAATDSTAAAAPPNCAPPGAKPTTCYSPQAYEVAYGVAPLLRRGIDGSGQTVVMAEVAQTPTSNGGPTGIRQDLAMFDTRFGLPPAKLQVVNTIAHSATPYLAGYVEVEDAEMVHAIAPGAILDALLVPHDAASSSASFAATVTKVIREGIALHAAVISFSAANLGEHFLTSAEVAQMNAALKQAREQHVTVISSSGDTGALSDHGPPVQVNMPAADPLVLAVGGTMLDASPTGTYLGEMAWDTGTEASGGGYSSLFPRPSYQDGIPRAGATRGVPDVAANAESGTAMAIAFSDGTLETAADANAATPLWAGVIALADQQAGLRLGFVNPAIYAIARSAAYHQAFHDVVAGDNSVLWPTGVIVGYNAGPGWDPVTGWGSPNARYLVPLLAHSARSGT